jgi:hypothetical protein
LDNVAVRDLGDWKSMVYARFLLRNFVPNATTKTFACVLALNGTGFSSAPLSRERTCFIMRYNTSDMSDMSDMSGESGSAAWTSPDAGRTWLSPEFAFVLQQGLTDQQARYTRLIKLRPVILESGEDERLFITDGLEPAGTPSPSLPHKYPVAPSTTFIAL